MSWRSPPARSAPPAEITKAQSVVLFNTHCQICHGADGTGSPLTPGSAFVGRKWKHGTTPQAIVNTITNGAPQTAMLPFKGRLSPEEIAALATSRRRSRRVGRCPPLISPQGHQVNGHEPPDVADQVASRAGRLPLCLFGMMVTAVQTFGFVVFESLPLLAALPFSAFLILGWMAACDGRSLLVDLIGPAQVEANLDDAACSTRRYTRRSWRVLHPYATT